MNSLRNLVFLIYLFLSLIYAQNADVYNLDRPLNSLKTSLNDIFPLNTDLETQKRPTPRAFHSLTATPDGRYLLVFGGLSLVGENGTSVFSSEEFLGDAHLYDTWTQGWSGPLARPWCCTSGEVEDALGPSPEPRERHRAAAINDMIWVHGGRGPSVLQGHAVEYKHDLQYFDIAAMTWSGEVATTGPLPPARAGHGMAAVGTDLYIFGGRNEDGPLNDMWLFDTGLHQWISISQRGDLPSPRSEFGFAATQEKLYLLGGTQSEETASRSQRHVFGDAYVFTVDSQTWEKVNCPVTSLREDYRIPLKPKLPERYHHQIVAVDDKYLMVWGGLWRDGSTILDDYSVLDLQACSWYIDFDALRSLQSTAITRAPAHYGQAVSVSNGLIYEFGGVTRASMEESDVGNTLYTHRTVDEIPAVTFSLIHQV